MGKGKKNRNQQQQHEHTDKYAVDSSGQASQQPFDERSSASAAPPPHASPEVDDYAQAPEHYEGR
ncbi:hypothetical protein AB0M28_39460 [Streptomyces sp. NPDC051940]|uniref:hypothetical protein n=1 Tax=Streptomyces sp. NPDC051940 TaxID=3155675 RepID=UPI003440563D